MAPIRLGILGGGIFARDAHLPALRALADMFEVVAIFSRNPEKAAALATTLGHKVATYTDTAALLSRDDIEAVDIVLPISVQPAAIEAALKAGKHVISEKPVAPDVVTGKKSLQAASQLTKESRRVWMIAENFRYEEAYHSAGQVIRRGDIGKPIQFSWSTYAAVNEHVKYYHTAWRRDNSFPGGFIMDGGVHNMAAMRTIMGEVESVSAFVRQVREDLPPADTLSATLRFESGAFGSFTATYAGEAPWDNYAHVIGDRGALRVNYQELEVTIDGKTSSQSFTGNAIQAELADFARAIQQGGMVGSTPQDALQDVAIIEAMLESAQNARIVKPQRIV
jgi:predicted dehydrogenase